MFAGFCSSNEALLATLRSFVGSLIIIFYRLELFVALAMEYISLPPGEKLELAEELWSSVEEELMPVTNEDIAFAEECLSMQEANPTEGMSLEELKKYSADILLVFHMLREAMRL